MIEFLVDKIYGRSVDSFLDRQLAFLWGANCAPLLVGLFFYSYENVFYINSLRMAKDSLLESSITHI